MPLLSAGCLASRTSWALRVCLPNEWPRRGRTEPARAGPATRFPPLLSGRPHARPQFQGCRDTSLQSKETRLRGFFSFPLWSRAPARAPGMVRRDVSDPGGPGGWLALRGLAAWTSACGGPCRRGRLARGLDLLPERSPLVSATRGFCFVLPTPCLPAKIRVSEGCGITGKSPFLCDFDLLERVHWTYLPLAYFHFWLFRSVGGI